MINLFKPIVIEHVNTVWSINVPIGRRQEGKGESRGHTHTHAEKQKKQWEDWGSFLCFVASLSPLGLNWGHRPVLSSTATNFCHNFKRRYSLIEMTYFYHGGGGLGLTKQGSARTCWPKVLWQVWICLDGKSSSHMFLYITEDLVKNVFTLDKYGDNRLSKTVSLELGPNFLFLS